jgi:hypothetical protein
MADLRRMTAMRRGGRYGFTRHRGSHNDQRTRRIGNSCSKERAVDRRAYGAIMSVAAHSGVGSSSAMARPSGPFELSMAIPRRRGNASIVWMAR